MAIAGMSVVCATREHRKCVVGCDCSCHAAEFQVVVPPSLQDRFRGWVSEQGLELFAIPPTPGVDDLPTFGIRRR